MKLKHLFGFSGAARTGASAAAGKTAVAAVPPESPAWRWRSHGISVVGNRRKINEDALLERPEIGLWMVADGMGGHHAGDVASRALVEALEAVEATTGLAALAEQVESSIAAVNRYLHHLAHDSMGGQIVGSTVVALVAKGRQGVAVWAGDSRLYRYRDARLEQLTRDHSLLDELVAAGLMSPEQALAEGNGNIITRAVGAEAGLDLDVLKFEVSPGDVYLLCSDGLSKELDSADIAAHLLRHGDPTACAQVLIDAALARGGRDNITVIVARPEAAA